MGGPCAMLQPILMPLSTAHLDSILHAVSRDEGDPLHHTGEIVAM